MKNILTAIKAIVKNSAIGVMVAPKGNIKNRANQMGAALEDYVKKCFCGLFGARFSNGCTSKE